MTPRNYNLSYGMEGVAWDGRQLARRPAPEISRTIDAMQKAGMNEIMIAAYHVEEPADFDLDAETRRIGRELESRGMKANQHHGYAACLAEPGTSQRQVVENLKRCIDYTANLHADNLVIHLGKLAGHYTSLAEEIRVFGEMMARFGAECVIDQVAENMREAGEYARRNNVFLAMENLDAFHHLSNIKQLPEIIRRADHPNVGGCLDFGHAHCAGVSPVRWIHAFGSKLFTTHIHDNHGNTRGVKTGELTDATKDFDEHLSPGLGTIDWCECITALWETGYDRTLSFESSFPAESMTDSFRFSAIFWRAAEKIAMRRLNYKKGA